MYRALCILSVILSSFTIYSQDRPADAALQEQVDKIFANWDKPDSPGCSLAVLQNDQTIYKRGYGSASLELRVPLTARSVFNIGSITKQITALSTLMLVQQGKLSLDDDAKKYAPELQGIAERITIRHLLHHTSGLRDFPETLEMIGWRTGDITTEKDVLDLVSRQRTLNHSPGEQFWYTNTGYVLLAVIIKRVSGQSLRDFAETNIFKPLGMTDTRFYEDHTAVIPGLANGYLPKTGGGFRKWMGADSYIGSSTLYSTVEDLAKWDANFYHKRVGGADVVDKMHELGALSDGTKLEYAQGLYVVPYKGLRTIAHNGSSMGYQGNMTRFPDQHFSVIVLCNVRGNNPEALAKRVADVYLAGKQQVSTPIPIAVAPADAPKFTEKELSAVEGLYWNPMSDLVRRIYVKDGKLFYQRTPTNETELAPIDPNRFIMVGIRSRTELSFKSTRTGGPLQMFFKENDAKPAVWEQVKPASYKPSDLTEFAGEYVSPELNTTYEITVQGAKLLFDTGNWGAFALSARFVDSFANPDEMGSLVFTRDDKKRVTGFVIRSGRVRNLTFTKAR